MNTSTPRKVRALRHWKQRFDVHAKFIWRKPVKWAGKAVVVGDPVPPVLLTMPAKLKRFWESHVIELAEFEDPDVQTGQRKSRAARHIDKLAAAVAEAKAKERAEHKAHKIQLQADKVEVEAEAEAEDPFALPDDDDDDDGDIFDLPGDPGDEEVLDPFELPDEPADPLELPEDTDAEDWKPEKVGSQWGFPGKTDKKFTSRKKANEWREGLGDF